jgi:hypothetical protein
MARCEPGPRSRSGRRGWLCVAGGPVAAALAIGLAGCGGNSHPAVDAGPAEPTWWQPQAGQVKNWDIQLSAKPGDVDVSTPRLMYDLDLWALVPSPTVLTYSDGSSVTVPAGALAGTIAELHARTPSTIVICHVETGALEMGRPDEGKFPAAAIGAVPPDLPTARVLDVSAAGRAAWTPIMFKRFDLAREIGCDGVEPAHTHVGAYQGTGFFMVKPEDNYSWYAEVAMEGHKRMLSTGMKDADLVGGAISPDAVAQFDWLMTERCGEFMQCDLAQPFIAAQKAVFAIDYDVDSGDDSTVPPTLPKAQQPQPVCMQQAMANIADGIFKDLPPSKLVWMSCPDVAM